MRFFRVARLLVVVALVFPSTPAGTTEAALRRLFPMSTAASFPAVAVAPDGTPHILYPSPDDRLRHAWRESGQWVDEPVDSRTSFCESGSLKVDSAGRLHVAYSAYPEEAPGALVYGVRDESGWTFTEVTPAKPGYRRAVVAIGSADVPRILFVGDTEGSLVLAVREGTSWNLTETGLSIGTINQQSDLELDGDDHAHILYTSDGQLLYATDASGGWEVTVVEESSYSPADLALDSAGKPHVLVSNSETHPDGGLVHLWQGEGSWQSEEVNPSGDPGRNLYVGGLVADDAGHLMVGFTEGRYVRGYSQVFARFAYFDGRGWREGKGESGRSGVVTSAALAPDGSLHLAGGGLWLRHLRIAMPDLKAGWEGLTTEVHGGRTRVTGVVTIQNQGASSSRPTRISFYLSADAVLDPEDEPVGRSVPIGRTRQGGGRRVPIALVLPGDSVGKRLLAVIDPQGRFEDIDRPNNTAVANLSE